MERHYYEQYYLNQIGGEIGPLYRSSFKVQRGRGLGGFFSGLWKSIKPLFTSAKPLCYKGIKAIGKEALDAGVGTLAELGTKPLKEAMMSNIHKAGSNLKRKAEEKLKKLSGEGLRIAHRWYRRKGIKKPKLRNVNPSKKRKRRAKVVKDIFS